MDMGRKEGGVLCPCLRNVAWDEVYFRTKWRLHPYSRLATMDMSRKLGREALPPFWGGELGPYLAECGLDRGPPPCKVLS